MERLYSYREVGFCNNAYVGASHTPDKRITDCLALITTAASLRISASAQTVTLIEEDLNINTDYELKSTVASRLLRCDVVDRENFSCQGLVRVAGMFRNTAAFGGRRLSSSFMASSLARATNGWLSSETLDFHDSAWSTGLYSVFAFFALIAFFVWVGA